MTERGELLARPRRWKVVALASLVVLGAAAALGMPRVKRWLSARACHDGDDAACLRACAAGEAGEQGCLAAAEGVKGDYEERRGQTFSLLDRACQLGAVAGCNRAIHMTRVGDARIEAWAARACALGDGDDCKLNAALALARHPERADAAAARLCQALPGDAATRSQCHETWRQRAREVVAARVECGKRERGACARLGAALLVHDATAALEAYGAECELRGLSGLFEAHAFECGNGLEWYHGPSPRSGAESCGFELLDADTEARAKLRYSGLGTPGPPSPEPVGAFPLAETAVVRLAITPPDDQLQVALAARERDALLCLDPRAASAGLEATTSERARELRQQSGRRYSARFVVDRFGEVPLRTVSGLSSKERACLTALYLSQLPAPASGRRVVLDYDLTAK